MPRFAFDARTASGEAIHGMEIAADEYELDRRLAADDLLLVRARPIRTRGRSKTNFRTLVDLCYHLAVVVESGIPMLAGLRDLASAGHPLADELDGIARKVEQGSTLSAAMDDYPEHFPHLVRALVRAGEESGSLDRVLQDLVRYLEWREELRREIRSALTYPSIIVVAMGGLVALLTLWVLPTFMQIFIELEVDLPITTRALIAVQDFAAAWGLHLLVLLIGGVIAAVAAYRREGPRAVMDGWLLRVPLLGNLALMLEMSRLSHNLGILHATGVPILKALSLSEQIAQNRPVRALIAESRERVEQGESLSETLGRGDLVPQLVLRMLAVGERSGKLEASLERVSAYYDREVPERIRRALALFNTGILVVLGGLLATIALSVFGPLYQMLGNLNAT